MEATGRGSLDRFVDSNVHRTNGARNAAGVLRENNGVMPEVRAPDDSDHQVQACRDALFLTDPEIDRANLISAKGKRVPGTCEWVKKNDVYLDWLYGDTHLLSICGGPGKGKTMLSIFLSEDLQQEDGQTLYYFCSAEDNKRNTASCILRGLLWMLLQLRPDLGGHVAQNFKTATVTAATLSSRETLWQIFARLFSLFEIGTIFCILDGLDECDDDSSKWLTTKLAEELILSPGQVHLTRFRIAIISRDYAGLERIPQLNLDPDNDQLVSLDVEKFVSVRVQDLSWLPGFGPDFEAEISRELLIRAEGTFLWVGFAMTELLKSRTLTAVRDTIHKLPKGLPAIYDRMLLQIEPEYRREVACILLWIALAIRPLTLRNLADALALDAVTSSHNSSRAAPDILVHCGPLIKLQDDIATLVHQSARDHLLRRDNNADPDLECFRITPEKGHLAIARGSLDMMMHSSLQQKDADPEILDKHGLLLYAILHLPIHVKGAGDHFDQLLTHRSGFFAKKSPLFENWRRALATFSYPEPPKKPLLLASWFGILQWVASLLEKKRGLPHIRRPINQSDFGGTALHYAAETGQVDVVVLLLDRGANYAAKNDMRQTALHSAAFNTVGSERITSLLLDRGTDYAAKDRLGHTALHCAAEYGNEKAVRLLLDRGADHSVRNNDGRTVLHLAAWNGQADIVSILLDRGADHSARDVYGRTALHLAPVTGRRAVVLSLLDRGADHSVRDRDGKTALHLAVSKDQPDIVTILLDRGADHSARDNDGSTALHEAAFDGRARAVLILLNRGADHRARDNDGNTPLDLARRRGYSSTVRLLRSFLSA